MDNSTIIKYLSGVASEQEVKNLFQWINTSPENRKDFIEMKKNWALTSVANENDEVVWQNFILAKQKFSKNKFFKRQFIQIAASILLIFSLGFATKSLVSKKSKLWYSSNTIIEVPAGEMSKLTLSDGTSVILNSGTTFSYSGNFSKGERIVQLDGEAFFDVEKDSKHPFIIKTKLLDFKVYGTSFNIEAYPESNQVSTTLVEGSLGFVNKKGDELGKLVPGENLLCKGIDNKINISNVSLDLYTSWKEGTIIFRNEKLENVAAKLERWYNVEIVIRSPKLANELYFGTVMKNKPIDQILEVLQVASSLKYQIIHRNDKPTLIYWE
ncbi:MAG: FecR family protein [Labilibaculum sp.]|nr:FecR family protein [Labilibaculum sp.]